MNYLPEHHDSHGRGEDAEMGNSDFRKMMDKMVLSIVRDQPEVLPASNADVNPAPRVRLRKLGRHVPSSGRQRYNEWSYMDRHLYRLKKMRLRQLVLRYMAELIVLLSFMTFLIYVEFISFEKDRNCFTAYGVRKGYFTLEAFSQENPAVDAAEIYNVALINRDQALGGTVLLAFHLLLTTLIIVCRKRLLKCVAYTHWLSYCLVFGWFLHLNFVRLSEIGKACAGDFSNRDQPGQGILNIEGQT